MDRIEEVPEEAYDLCGKVIGLAMKVHSAVGPGFLESVYQNALIWELRKSGFKAETERPISVQYDGQIVGAFTADLLVNDSLIVELKASEWKLWDSRRTAMPKSWPWPPTSSGRNRSASSTRRRLTSCANRSITSRAYSSAKKDCARSRA